MKPLGDYSLNGSRFVVKVLYLNILRIKDLLLGLMRASGVSR